MQVLQLHLLNCKQSQWRRQLEQESFDRIIILSDRPPTVNTPYGLVTKADKIESPQLNEQLSNADESLEILNNHLS